MIYPPAFEDKIGFTTIREMLKEACISDLGENHVEMMGFETDVTAIQTMLDRTEEFRQLLLSGENIPTQNYFNLVPELKRIRLKGTIITEDSLFDLKSSLRTINDYITFLGKLDEELYPSLFKLASEYNTEITLYSDIDAIVDDKGKIRDSASPKLKEIRRDLISKQSEIDKKISSVLTMAKRSGWSDGDVEATIRNGRLVIPVYAASKRKIKGLIHDYSSTGQTVFIEPEEVFGINNEIRELYLAENHEILRILEAFTILLRPALDDIIALYQLLGLLDFIRAKARFAIDIAAHKPKLLPDTIINWHEARHPLLYLSHRKQGKPVVPLDLSIDRKNHIIIISGPNAGGKSVCMKTAGLLQYMLQCGMLIPAKPDSQAGIFEHIFIDIGDEQSLENDLSTYSSHLINMKYLVDNIDDKTLFLIDEFGAGTEPQIGGAIAETLLYRFNKSKAIGIITTHYTNLKLIGGKVEGIVNGAMLFDAENMKPLYKLRTGRPGSSFAFEIAKSTGFNNDIIEDARERSGATYIDLETQMQQLETDKEFIQVKKTELKVADEFLSEMIEKYNSLTVELEEKKKSIVNEAREEAGRIVKDANKRIENTIKEIRESQANKEKTKTLRKDLNQLSDELLAEKKPEENNETPAKKAKPVQANVREKESPREEIKELLPGMFVILKGQQQAAEVAAIEGKNIILIKGNIKLTAKRSQVEKILKNDPSTPPPKKSYTRVMNEMRDRLAGFTPAIDLRGKRVEEALQDLQKLIDDAILTNSKELRILHGKGDGILRQAIREYLNASEEIKNYRDEHIDRGGHGITLANLK